MSAPWVIDGPVNGEVFTLYVEKALAPTLAKGEVVILDNKSQGKVGTSSPHQGSASALQRSSQSDRVVFAAKLEHLLRKAAARTVDAVCAVIGELLGAFTSEECANYLKSSGYRS
jgi:hypothetical protein